MKKEIYKYPYNAAAEDETKIFLSDLVCEQFVRITSRNGQIICNIKNKISSKKKEIIVSAAFGFGALSMMPKEARPIGLSPRPTSTPIVRSQTRYENRVDVKIAPIVSKSSNKIRLMPTNEMIPLIYLNTRHVYINEKILKRLRAGDLSANVTVATIGIIVYLMFQLSSGMVDAFAIVAQWNAPTTTGGQGPAPVSPPSAPVQRSGRPTTGLEMEKPDSMPQQEYSDITKSEKRKLPDPRGRDRSINVNGYPRLDLRFNQVEFKTPKHGGDHGLPVDNNGKTLKTEANAIALRDSLVNMPNKANIVWYTDGQYQGGTDHGCASVNLFDPDTNIIAVYEKQPDGSNLFLTTCTLTETERDHLKSTNGNFVTDKILEQQNWVSESMEVTPISPMNENSSPGFTPTSSFESDIMGITPIDNSQLDNP